MASSAVPRTSTGLDWREVGKRELASDELKQDHRKGVDVSGLGVRLVADDLLHMQSMARRRRHSPSQRRVASGEWWVISGSVLVGI